MMTLQVVKMRRSESHHYGSDGGLYSTGSDSNGQTPSLASIYQVTILGYIYMYIFIYIYFTICTYISDYIYINVSIIQLE